MFNDSWEKENMLILDYNTQSTTILNGHLSNLGQAYRIKGFIRYGTRSNLRLNGYYVYSVDKQIKFNRLMNRLQIKAILFPDHSSVKKEDKRLVYYCQKKKIKMLILPSLDEIKQTKINFHSLKEVRIEDLLERKEIKINMQEISVNFHNKVVLVTGAAGSIGSELCKQLCHFKLKRLILFDNAETPMHNLSLELNGKFPQVKYISVLGDVRDKKRVNDLMERYSPDVIFHAAAYKHVPMMESNPCEAVHTNVWGTIVMADMAVKYQVRKFIMISTDKAVNPTNVMGASKRLAEVYVQSLGLAISKGTHKGITHFVTTRFGNVLGSNGSVIPLFKEQLAKGGPITVTHPDIIRYFMTIPEACRLVLEAASMNANNEIFVFDMGKPVKIANLARRMVELAGKEPGKDIKIEYTGLRAGEKLFEELLTKKENTLPTSNEKIFRAKARGYDYKIILPQLLRLCETAKNINLMETVRQMKMIVPEFKSKQSEYEYLDKENIIDGIDIYQQKQFIS